MAGKGKAKKPVFVRPQNGKKITSDEALQMGYALADALGIKDDQGEKPTK